MRIDVQRIRGFGLLLLVASALAQGTARAEGHAEEGPPQIGIPGLALEGELLYDATTLVGTEPGPGAHGVQRALITLGVALNLEDAVGWAGLEAFASWQWFQGENGSELAHDGLGFSNIDSESFQRIAELWVEQSLQGGRLRFKLGSIDANSDLAFVENAGVFLNSSFGLSPSVDGLATYPAAALGAQIRLQTPEGHAYAGIFSGCSTPHRLCWEMRHPVALAQLGREFKRLGPLRGLRLDIGAWSRFGEVDPGDPRTWGIYFLSDVRLVEMAEERGFYLFALGGYAETGPDAPGHHLGIGFEWRGPLVSRSEDGLGVAFTSARFPRPNSSVVPGEWGWESAIEFFYRLQLTEALSLQPDFQYLLQPGGGRASGNLAALTLRVAASF